MASIQSPGIGSGLDINSIISSLMAVEKIPLNKLDSKEIAIHTEISGYGTLKSALSSLQSAMSNLAEANTFRATAAQSSDEDVYTVSSDTTVIASSYDVTVNRLAQQHKLGSSSFASTDTFGANGDVLTITSGTTSFDVNFTAAMTLEEIQAAINVQANETGISAGLITGDNGNQTLVLTSGASGYDARMQLTFSGTIDPDPFSFSNINRDSNGALLGSTSELDASMIIDGVAVTRGSNAISDAVSGVTFSLVSEGRAQTTIAQDTSVATEAVDAFITAYNDLQSKIASLSRTSLKGSSITRSIDTQLRNVLNSEQSGLGSFAYLSEIGVTTTEDGGFELDSDMLLSALENDLDSTVAFFSDATQGFAVRLDNTLAAFLDTDGIVDSVVESANSRISRIEKDRDSLERRLEIIEKGLRSQFTTLDLLVSQMSSTSNFLTSQLDSLSNLITGNRK